MNLSQWSEEAVQSLASMFRRRVDNLLRKSYPTVLHVESANQRTVEEVEASGARVYAEIGVYEGHTAEKVASILSRRRGTMYLFDFDDRVLPLKQRLDALRLPDLEIKACSNTHKDSDSYCWSLMKLLKEHREPIFDYVFLDGAHTWELDGFAFLLADRLLRPGGTIDFDDAGWSLEISPSLNPRAFPRTARRYTDEQIKTAHVDLIVDLLVKRDPRYREIVANKIYRRCDSPA